MTNRGSFILSLVGGGFLLAGVSCSLMTPQPWDASVYPDRAQTDPALSLGPFPSLDDCRAASRDKLARLNATQQGDYECGLNCRVDESADGARHCDDTQRGRPIVMAASGSAGQTSR